MRSYDILITQPSTGALVQRFTSRDASGRAIPGALNIEWDIPVAPFATPMGAAWVRVWGVSLAQISQSSDLNGMNIQVFGGMQKGLPLANPMQYGLLVQGQIFQAFGNWIDTNQTLQ